MGVKCLMCIFLGRQIFFIAELLSGVCSGEICIGSAACTAVSSPRSSHDEGGNMHERV